MALIDPRLRTAIPNHWSSKCTIETVTYTTSGGQKVPSGGTPVASLTNIPCRLGPLILLRPTDAEDRDGKVISKIKARHCVLNIHTTAIEVRTMRAVVDGVAYPIRGVENDSEKFLTRMRLEEITP